MASAAAAPVPVDAAAAADLSVDLSQYIGVPETPYKTTPVENDYDILWEKKLGTGINGAVIECRERATGARRALKFLRVRKESRREIALHFACSAHDNVVSVFAAYDNVMRRGPRDTGPPARVLLLVMELMEGGELFDRVIKKGSLTEREASAVMRQVVEALSFCHRRSIAHRDLKPENLLYASEDEGALLKLSDFGFAKVDRGDLTTAVYTPYYVAPQILEAKAAAKAAGAPAASSTVVAYDKSCDMWSFGVILYILLCGYPPFSSMIPDNPLSETMQLQIRAGSFEFHQEYWADVSSDAKDVVRGLICTEPKDRLDVEQLRMLPWVRDGNVPETPLMTPGYLSGSASSYQEQLGAELTLMRQCEPQHIPALSAGLSKNKLKAKREAKARARAAAGAATAATRGDTDELSGKMAHLSTV